MTGRARCAPPYAHMPARLPHRGSLCVAPCARVALSPVWLLTPGCCCEQRFPSATLSETTVSNWLGEKAQPLVGQYSYTTKTRYLGSMSSPKQPVLVVFLNLDFDDDKAKKSAPLDGTGRDGTGRGTGPGGAGLGWAGLD